MPIDIQFFAPDDPAAAAFHEVYERAGARVPDEAVPPRAECGVALRRGRPVARVSLFAPRGAPAGRHARDPAGGTTDAPARAMVGHYEALEDAAGILLLRHARERLADRGAATVLGPMNGSTWRRYRLALPAAGGAGDGGETPFLGEPVTPPGYVAHFAAAGFEPVAHYQSRIVPLTGGDSPARDPMDAERRSPPGSVPPAGGRLDLPLNRTDGPAGASARAVETEPLRLADWDAAIAEIHELSLAAFAGNAFYTPIPLGEFRRLYDPLRPLLDPALVRLARTEAGRLVGVVLAYPDPLGERAGGVRRVVLKSLAVHPDARGTGLGTRLTGEVHSAAASAGAGAVIHALMHEGNPSNRISAGARSRLFRRYALFGWTAP